MSSPPSSWMNPNPFDSLNHLTAPCWRPPPPPEEAKPTRLGDLWLGAPWPGGLWLEAPWLGAGRRARAGAGASLRDWKQSRQKIGRPELGMNGTWVSEPHCEQTAVNISRWPRLVATEPPFWKCWPPG